MKNDKKDIFVILGMCFLLLLVMIPPLLRIVIPKQQDSIVTKEKVSTNTILTCTKNFPTEKYTTVATITYKDNNFISNQITYNKVDNLIEENNTTEGYLPSQEMNFFKGLNNINIIDNENSTTVILDNKSLTNNPDNQILKNYLLNEQEETSYYENQGYICNKKTS